jgi:acetyl esterase
MALTDAATRQFLDILASSPGPAPHTLPAVEARKMSVGLRSAFPDTFPAPDVDVEDKVIAGGPNGDLSIHIVRPPNVRGLVPVIVFIHGGGWVFCDFSTHERLVKEIAAGTGAAVVFIDYSLSPEVRYPVAVEECYFATQYVAATAAVLGIDSSRIAIAGDSAGGNMASVVCMMTKERGGHPLAGTALLYPLTNSDFHTDSYNEFADGHFLTRDAMKWFWDNYLPDSGARREPHASPLQASAAQLRGFPPAFVMTCECDVLRDEGEAFARKLIEAGVDVTATRYLGTIHSCLTLGPMANTPAVRSAIAAVCAWLRGVLTTR